MRRMERRLLGTLFGAHAQIAVGVTTFAFGVGWWVYFETIGEPNVRNVFRISMFFGLVACYAIIATGLGYRKTEQVSTEVVEEIKHADEVTVEVKK